MATHKNGAHSGGTKPTGAEAGESGITLPQHVVIAIALFALLLVSLLFPSDITRAMYTIAVAGATLLLFALMGLEVPNFSKDRLNLFAAVAGLMLLAALMGSGSDALLIMLFSAYLFLAVLFSGRVMKLQTAIIIAIAITAILFRVYPAMPGSGNMAGHLISMDDPYYHYKLTNDLYTNGIIEPIDFRVYPPLGWVNNNLFPYYYNTYLARMTNNPLHDIMLLYPVLISAFGAVMMFFLLKELSRDWKSGAIGGLIYATMPMLLTKSAAGAVEEDVMGMAMGIFALYLLIKAIRSKGSANIKFAVMAGFALLILLVTWGGIMFFFAIPFVALGLYAIVALLLKYDIWEVTRAGLIAGAILIAGNFLLLGRTDMMEIAPYGFFVFFGVWGEVLRTKYFNGEDNKLAFEKDYIFPFAALITIGLIVFAAVTGVDNVLSIPEKALETYAGTTSYNFLVDKTIAEQGALASGSLQEKLAAGFGEYGIGEVLTVIMAGAMAVLVLFYFFKDRDKMFDLLLAYLIGLVFFAVTMTFVWGEARLGFSQALGFIILGAMAGLFLPGSFKELGSFKIITLLIAIVIPLAVFWPSFAGGSYWEMTHRGASVDPAWFLGVQWLESHIVKGGFQGDNYINGDVVFTWWDYGHFITAMSHATTATDPTQHDEDYIMRTARFFYNFTTEESAVNWLENQPFNINDSNGSHKLRWIILDYSLVGKAGALAFLGTNYYEYPNGETAVNGTCSRGEVCQNVENGLTADNTNGKYTCKQGVVCTRDALTQVDVKKCCEAEPAKCCDASFKFTDIDEKGGSAVILRSPGTPVYGNYMLSTGNYACRQEYSTSTEPLFLVEDGERKTVNSRYLYTGYGGLPYADGVDYPAFVIFTYSDGTQKMRFIASNCDTKEYGEVMGLGKDLLVNMQYGVRLSDTAVAPQVFVHVPERWMNSMFTELYLKDAKDLKYFKLVDDAETQKFYPSIKIYEVKYPGELPPEPEVKGAKDGDLIEANYTGKLENGTIFDSSEGRAPLKFTLGAGQLIPGFEEAVYGMEAGQSKEVIVPPEKAYDSDPSNRLYNKTLIFDITIVSINKKDAVNATVNGTQGQLNMTFDYYGPAMNEKYKIDKFPTIVFNCQYKRFGSMGTQQEEIGALSRLFCIVNKAVPSDFCGSMGISVSNETGKVMVPDNTTMNLASSLVKTSADSCVPGANSTLIQAFYSDTCTDCLSQKELLDSLESALSDYVSVDYYCAGNETYCISRSAAVIA